MIEKGKKSAPLIANCILKKKCDNILKNQGILNKSPAQGINNTGWVA